MTLVLDASLFVSALIPVERSHARARRLLDEHRAASFLVPSIFQVEVTAALARRGVSAAVLAGARAAMGTAQFDVRSVDELIGRAVVVASTARLRAYDAVYAALAIEAGAPLATLDAELRDRLAAAWPSVVVIGADPQAPPAPG